jgi:hypothetical protein
MSANGKKGGASPAGIAVAAVGFLIVLALGFVAVTGLLPVREGAGSGAAGDNGFSYLVRFLRKLGYPVKVLPELPSLESGPWSDGGTLLSLSEDLSDEWPSLAEWVEAGGRLILPATATGSDYHYGYETYPAKGNLETGPSRRGEGAFPVPFEAWVFRDPMPGWEEILLLEGTPIIIEAPLGAGKIDVISDGFALSNASFKAGGEEFSVFLNEFFLESRPGPIALYLERGWIKAPLDPVRALLSGRFLPLTIQLILAFAVFAWGAAFRFGRPLGLDPRSARSTRSHLDAVGAFYARARASGLADLSNSEHFARRAASLLGLSQESDAESIAARAAKTLAAGKADALGEDRWAGIMRTLLAPEAKAGPADMAKRSDERNAILELLNPRGKT